jgi:hypothetical protein
MKDMRNFHWDQRLIDPLADKAGDEPHFHTDDGFSFTRVNSRNFYYILVCSPYEGYYIFESARKGFSGKASIDRVWDEIITYNNPLNGDSYSYELKMKSINPYYPLTEIRLSKGQRSWLMDEIMWGTYEVEEYYKDLWAEVTAGRDITELDPLHTLMDGIIDRWAYGDRDRESLRDRGFAIRIMKKITKES